MNDCLLYWVHNWWFGMAVYNTLLANARITIYVVFRRHGHHPGKRR